MKKLLTIMLSVTFIMSACGADVDPESLESSEAEQNASETPEEPENTETTDQPESSENEGEEESESKEQNDDTASNESEEEAAEEQTEEDTTAEESGEEDTVVASGNDSSSEEEEAKEEKASNVGLKAYMPEQPMTKTFMQNDEFEAVYEIVDIQGDLVQQVITFGDMVTLQVLQWTEGTVSVVYEEFNPEDTKSMLDGFKPVETVDVLMDVTQSSQSDSSFKIIDQQQSTSTPARDFEDVLVVQKIEKADSTGAEVRSTFHYAPDYGLVKEKVVNKGENGYTMNSELMEIK